MVTVDVEDWLSDRVEQIAFNDFYVPDNEFRVNRRPSLIPRPPTQVADIRRLVDPGGLRRTSARSST